MKTHRWDLLSIAILACLTAIFLWRVIFLGQIILPVDMLYKVEPWKSESIEKPGDPPWNPNLTDSIWQLYPILSYAKEARQAGEGYFWDPYLVGGMPAMARGEMFLNPVAIILSTIFPIDQTLNGLAVIHLFLAGLFTYLLLREMGTTPYGALMGGLAFAYNSYLIAWFALANFHNTAIWLPLIMWGIERAIRRQDWRWIIVGAFVFALQIVYGYILWPFYGGITLILFAVYRSAVTFYEKRSLRASTRPILYTGLALVLGTLLAMPQLLPTIQLFSHTSRTTPVGANSFLDYKSHLIRLFTPTILGNGIRGNMYRGQSNYPETTLYFGVISLFFIFASIFSPKRRVAWGLVGLGSTALLALYHVFPFHQVVALIYPVFINTNPARILYIVAFTWSIATGLGADWLATKRPRTILRWLSLLAGSLAAGFLILWRSAIRLKSIPVNELSNPIKKHLAISDPTSLLISSALLLITVLIFWGLRQQRINRNIIPIIALAVLASDLFIAGINYNSTFDPKFVFPETPSLTFLSNLETTEKEPYRILDVHSAAILHGMSPEIYHLQTLSGYTSWVLSRYSEYAYLTHSRIHGLNDVYFFDCCHHLIDAMNVKYVYTPKGTTLSDLSSGTDFAAQFHEAKVEPESAPGVYNTVWTLQGQGKAVLYQHPPSQVTYELYIDKPAKLDTAITLHPEAWYKPGDGVLFEIHVYPPNSATDSVIFSRYIDPKNNPSERTTIPVEVDLGQYVDQKIHLSFVTGPGPNNDNSNDWAGWVEPRIEKGSPSPLTLIYDGHNRIYENKEAFPRAWVVHRVTRVATNDIEAVKDYLSNPEHNLAVEAVVESDDQIDRLTKQPLGSANPNEDVSIILYSPNRIVIEAELEKPGLLILSDMMYPGWTSYVNGNERKILTTNLIMRGLFLEAGKHMIEFVYRPYLFRLGSAIALTTVLLIAIFLVASFKRTGINLSETITHEKILAENDVQVI